MWCVMYTLWWVTRGQCVTRAESLSAANGHCSDCGACPHIASSDFANAKLLSIIPLLHTRSGGPVPLWYLIKSKVTATTALIGAASHSRDVCFWLFTPLTPKNDLFNTRRSWRVTNMLWSSVFASIMSGYCQPDNTSHHRVTPRHLNIGPEVKIFRARATGGVWSVITLIRADTPVMPSDAHWCSLPRCPGLIPS